MNIIVTGVSKGLGKEIAELLIKRGNKVCGISRTLPDIKGMEWIEYDLGKPEKLFETLDLHFKDCEVHGLVNNAAVAYTDLALEMDVKSVKKMFQINVFSVMEATKFAIKQMLLFNNIGNIVNISSICTKKSYIGLSAYASSKSAVNTYTKHIAKEYVRKGIMCNSILAGYMETNMSSGVTSRYTVEVKKVAWLACDLLKNNWELNGCVIDMDGGALL